MVLSVIKLQFAKGAREFIREKKEHLVQIGSKSLPLRGSGISLEKHLYLSSRVLYGNHLKKLYN